MDLKVEIMPQVFNISFKVLDIDSSYNMLLGRPWLHMACALSSIIHQKLKFIGRNQMEIVMVKEAMLTFQEVFVPYLEDSATLDASFHCLKLC